VDKSATRDPPTGAQVVGHGREVLALVELGPVTLEALPDGVFDVAGQGGGGLAVALQEQHGRPNPRSASGVQRNGLLEVTVVDRYVPLVTAAYGTRVARPATTTMAHT
jgi:hypothetical protein